MNSDAAITSAVARRPFFHSMWSATSVYIDHCRTETGPQTNCPIRFRVKIRRTSAGPAK